MKFWGPHFKDQRKSNGAVFRCLKPLCQKLQPVKIIKSLKFNNYQYQY